MTDVKSTATAAAAATTTTTATSLKQRYNKRRQPGPKFDKKQQYRLIKAAEANDNELEVERLTRQIPVRVPKPREQAPLNGLPKLNQKSKKKVKAHAQTYEPYAMTPMNVVSAATTTPSDVDELKHCGYYAKYVPVRFPAASCTVKTPHSVISAYCSGEVGLAGSKKFNDALIAAGLYDFHLAILHGREMGLSNISAVNITTSANIGVPVNLGQFYKEHSTKEWMGRLKVEYEPQVIESVRIRRVKQTAAGAEELIDPSKPIVAAAATASATTKRKATQQPVSGGEESSRKKRKDSTVVNLFSSGRLCTVGHPSFKDMYDARDSIVQYITDWAIQKHKERAV